MLHFTGFQKSIQAAIGERRLVSLLVKDRWLVAEPHMFGRREKGGGLILLLWCWEPEWGWKILDLSKMGALNTLPLQTFEPRAFPMDLAAKFSTVIFAVAEVSNRLAGREGFAESNASRDRKQRAAGRQKAG